MSKMSIIEYSFLFVLTIIVPIIEWGIEKKPLWSTPEMWFFPVLGIVLGVICFIKDIKSGTL